MKEFEKCVMCKKKTNILKTDDISIRKYYIVGAGQLCKECFDKIYLRKNR